MKTKNNSKLERIVLFIGGLFLFVIVFWGIQKSISEFEAAQEASMIKVSALEISTSQASSVTMVPTIETAFADQSVVEEPVEDMEEISYGPPCSEGNTFSPSGGYYYSENHHGYDGWCSDNLAASVADGVIFEYYQDLLANSDLSLEWDSSGMTYIVKHVSSSGTCYSIYGHLDEGYKSKGDFIKGGEVLGKIGNSGESTGTHLHIGIKCEKEDENGNIYLEWIDPAYFALGTR